MNTLICILLALLAILIIMAATSHDAMTTCEKTQSRETCLNELR